MAERLEKGILIEEEKPNLVDGRSSEGNRRKERDVKVIKEIGEQPNTTFQQLYGHNKKATRRGVDVDV